MLWQHNLLTLTSDAQHKRDTVSRAYANFSQGCLSHAEPGMPVYYNPSKRLT